MSSSPADRHAEAEIGPQFGLRGLIFGMEIGLPHDVEGDHAAGDAADFAIFAAS